MLKIFPISVVILDPETAKVGHKNIKHVCSYSILIVILCLVQNVKKHKDEMTPECVAALSGRKNMWKHAKLVGIN